MKFERRIYLGIAIILIGFLPLVLGAFIAIRKVVREQNSLVSTNAQAVLFVERLRYIASTKQSREFDEIVDQIDKIDDDPQLQAIIDQIRDVAKELNKVAQPGAGPLGLKSRNLIENLVALEANKLAKARRESDETVEQVVVALAVLSIFAVVLFAIVGRLIAKF